MGEGYLIIITCPSLSCFGFLSFVFVYVCLSTFGMVDSEETCIVVMVYNMANSWGVLIGDTVVIPEPLIKRNIITHKDEVGVSCCSSKDIVYVFAHGLMLVFLLWQSFDFRSIRVDSPLLLIVNGKKQNVHSQIATSISCKPHRE